jgi:hypothetical protein
VLGKFPLRSFYKCRFFWNLGFKVLLGDLLVFLVLLKEFKGVLRGKEVVFRFCLEPIKCKLLGRFELMHVILHAIQ